MKFRICQRNIGSETKKAINSTSFKGIKNGEVTSIAIRVFWSTKSKKCRKPSNKLFVKGSKAMTEIIKIAIENKILFN